MVETLRSGVSAAETIIGGMGGGIAYSIIQDGIVTNAEFVQILASAAVLMALFITMHWYFELRTGEQFH